MPPITRAQVETRLAQLRNGLEDLQSKVLATSGAIQDCEYWLAQLSNSGENDDNQKENFSGEINLPDETQTQDRTDPSVGTTEAG